MKLRGKATLWLVAAVCFGPFALAMLVYYADWDWLPQLPGSRELVQPAASIASLPLTPAPAADARAQWSLIYARIGPCEEQCSGHLERLRQVHWALGRDLDRVRRVFLHGDDAAPQISGDLVRGRIDVELEPALAAALRAERTTSGRVYIADPRGNLVVSYPPDVDRKELLRDLERLLDSSGID